MSAQSKLQSIEGLSGQPYTMDEIDGYVGLLKGRVGEVLRVARLIRSTTTLRNKLEGAMRLFLIDVSADEEQRQRAMVDLDGIIEDLLDNINYDPMPALLDIIDDATVWQINEIEET